jgi:trigger factor
MVKLTVEVPAEKFIKAINAVYNRNKKKITVPGFRKGHAPMHMLEKIYGAGIFFEEAANDLINETYGEEAESTGLEFVSRPVFDIDQIEKGKDFIYTAEIAVRPEVELGEYRGIEVKKQETLVSDDEVNEEIKREQEKNSRLVEVSGRPVQDGDTVVLDYSGAVDGEKFEGGTAENHTLVIGSGSFIPGFEEQLIGMNAEETKDITVTFPEEYHAPELAGKEAVFTCTIHKIEEKELPELDDEFAQDVSEYDTFDEYKKSVMDMLTVRKQQAAKTALENEAVDKLIESSKMDIPEAMIDAQVTNMYQDYARQLQSQGIPIDTYLQYMGSSEEKLKEEMRPQALKQIQTRLVLEEVAKDAHLEANDLRIEEEIEKIAERYQMEADKLRESMGDYEREQLGKDIAVQEAIDLIVDTAKEV